MHWRVTANFGGYALLLYMEYRLDIFKQIRGYYSIVFSGEHEIKPMHTSLYMFLLNQNNRCNWAEWFKCPFDLAMMGSGINAKGTYYKTLNDLQKFGFIKVIKGVNNFKAPKIKIINLESSVSNLIPLSEPLLDTQPIPLGIPLLVPLPIPLPIHIIKQITDNNKQVTDNINIILDVLKKTSKDKYKFNPEYKLCLEFWLKEFHIGWTFTGAGGKALKSIIVKIDKVLKDAGTEIKETTIVDTFKIICLKLPVWYKDKDLLILDSKFNEIVTEIKNSNNGTPAKDNLGRPVSKYHN